MVGLLLVRSLLAATASCAVPPNGIMDFEALGYTPARVDDLQNLLRNLLAQR